MEASVSFVLNGKPQTVVTDSERSLLEVLREDLHLTGTKYGCGEGQCRACTVLVGGDCVPSCLTSISDVNGMEVLTIEGVAGAARLHPVQEAFVAEGAFQCGYCTVGMIMGLVGVLKKNPGASEADALSELQKHICRCGSYAKYLKAVRQVLNSNEGDA
ncbi:MAG TPA: (2Fe-2S)-binding protein [Verrucomicrobiae bacterium]|jgi:aerobic-type carbon monoxide dehydrogenase small subunit (CoxS/CutS family)|nr:(2Fe-2S)-binding protein [Verrucomicrobiae bacterium]